MGRFSVADAAPGNGAKLDIGPGERIASALAHLLQQARCADKDFPYDSLFVRAEALRERLLQDENVVFHEGMDADEFPCFRYRIEHGLIDIRLCPFSLIALMSHEEGVETARAERLLLENSITFVSASDLAMMPLWNGASVAEWLFPQRLSDILALFDHLRVQYQPEPHSVQDLETIRMANTVTLAEVQGRSVPDLLRQVARERRPLVVLLEDGETVTLEAQAALPPLPVLDGSVPEGWREAIYERD